MTNKCALLIKNEWIKALYEWKFFLDEWEWMNELMREWMMLHEKMNEEVTRMKKDIGKGRFVRF